MPGENLVLRLKNYGIRIKEESGIRQFFQKLLLDPDSNIENEKSTDFDCRRRLWTSCSSQCDRRSTQTIS